MLDFLLEKDVLPDSWVRWGIRRLLAQRLRDEAVQYRLADYAADLRRRPIAESTAEANEQHYEIPARFYRYCLGQHLKYSGCLFPTGGESLDQAEEAMLALYVERGQIADGQSILELGCGWGSLSLYLAERFPRAQITAVSNSGSQKEYILSESRRRGLANLRIITCDMNELWLAPGQFDRVISVEMFEHMKNYQRLMAKVAAWLKPTGLLFVHIFTHRSLSYHFVPRDTSDWMARYFFTGGQMPAHDLLPQFQDDLRLVAEWQLDGTHYARTAEEWLRNFDAHRAEIFPLLIETYGRAAAKKWWAYWRIFFLSCAELWGYEEGREWQVSHYRFQRPAGAAQ